jgi:hypothetical protein
MFPWSHSVTALDPHGLTRVLRLLKFHRHKLTQQSNSNPEEINRSVINIYNSV